MRIIIILLLSLTTSLNVFAQKIATFEVEMPSNTVEERNPDKVGKGVNIPVSVNLDALTFLSESSLSLVEIVGGKTVSTPFQISQSENRLLHWIIKNDKKGTSKRIFQLNQGNIASIEPMHTLFEDGVLTINANNHNLLSYVYKTVFPPKGQDTAFKRSGFIHPLWSPKGQVLTRIQPPDHYHHYGVWNAWTHVLFEKDTVDFWNIKGRQGTVRFAKFTSNTEGGVFAEYEALQEHVAFKKDGSEKVAINEIQTVRVYRPDDNADYYIMDYTSKLNCASQSPVKLLEYRYAGTGWRTTEKWDNKNSEVLTSEGKNRKESDGTNARWCIVQGAIDDAYAGAVMMSYPANYNHPEPLRIWPENQYNRGDMYAMFAPTKDKDWLLEPGKTYTLRYRWLVFNGKMTKEKAEAAWQSFAHAPKITIK